MTTPAPGAAIELQLPDDCLVVFVDDTGHEALLPDQPVYGLGGCAVLAQDLDALIRQPWREVRRQVTGLPDTPLHASEFGQNATKENIEAVAAFFRRERFARLGAILTIKTTLPGTIDPLQTIAMVLQKRVADIAQWTRFRSVAIIFESSERADALIQDAFQNIRFEEDGKPIPAECFFMHKRDGEPGLEVADFIMHAIGRQARKNLVEHGQFVLDFAAVFHEFDPKLVSFIEIETVVKNEA